MSFFNKKTDVISVELTQYGKHLLSIGKFKPAYYDFFDNDVLYDGQYGGISEARNNIQNRIKNETPYLKPQYLFYGIETKLKEQIKQKHQLESDARARGKKINANISFQQPEDKIYFTSSPLGTSNLSDKYPIFNVYAYESQIISSSMNKILNNSLLRIPQIVMQDSKYEIVSDVAGEDELIPENYTMGSNFAENSEIIFKDRTSIKVNKNHILLEFHETNIKEISDNFEIELFEITSSLKGQETYKQLYFTDSSTDPEHIMEDSTLVDYYFNIKADNEIDTNSLNKVNNKPKIPKVFQSPENNKQTIESVNNNISRTQQTLRNISSGISPKILR